MLRRQVWTYAPDIILLISTPGNDIRNSSRVLERDERGPYFLVKNGQLVDQRIDGTRRFGQQEEALAWLQGEVGLDMAIYMEPQDSAWKGAWQVTENLIKLMHAEIKSGGKMFMAITVSSGPQVGPDQAARRVLERRLGVTDLFYAENRLWALGENSFEVLALAPLFQAYAEEYRIFLHGFPNSGLGQIWQAN